MTMQVTKCMEPLKEFYYFSGDLGGQAVIKRNIFHFPFSFIFNNHFNDDDLFNIQVNLLRFDHLCDGQWSSMVNLSPRLPIKKQSTVSETTDLNIQKEEMNIKKMDNIKRFVVTEKPDFEKILDDEYAY